MVIVLQSKNNKKVENKKRLMAKLLCFSKHCRFCHQSGNIASATFIASTPEKCLTASF